jgi:hypothetical protein
VAPTHSAGKREAFSQSAERAPLVCTQMGALWGGVESRWREFWQEGINLVRGA